MGWEGLRRRRSSVSIHPVVYACAPAPVLLRQLVLLVFVWAAFLVWTLPHQVLFDEWCQVNYQWTVGFYEKRGRGIG